MKSEILSNSDWMSPKLNLVDQNIQPRTSDKVSVKCLVCCDVFKIVYRDLIRSTNKHLDIGLLGYHCGKCLRQTEQFKNMHRNNSIRSVDKIKKGASERSKKLWECEDYRTKMETNHAKLRVDEDFALKISNSVKEKFKDPSYLEKIKQARKKYWNSSYRQFRSWDKDEFIKQAINEHGDKYEYDDVIYYNIRTKIEINCPKHGNFSQRPSHHVFYGNGCPQCAFEIETSKPQLQIFEWIKSLGFNAILNDRQILDGLELDILIPDYNLAIEYHGGYWHSFDRTERSYERMRHSNKCDAALKKGIHLLQIFDAEWEQQQDLIKSMIRNRLGLSKRIYARRCSIVNIDKKDYYAFCDQKHLSGRKPCDVCYGLEYDNQIVSVISFTNKGDFFELERFCSRIGHVVVGGLSKLLKAANIQKLMTYADRRYSDARGYINAGFNIYCITKPGYYYWRNGQIFNRRSFQKHRLSRKLATFDPNLTESENMFNNGYRRIWDAGHYKLFK